MSEAELAKVLGKDGKVVATAPDPSWTLCGSPSWPEEGTLVETCWASRYGARPYYMYGKSVLIQRDDDKDYAIWDNTAGQRHVISPDFWRPQKCPTHMD